MRQVDWRLSWKPNFTPKPIRLCQQAVGRGPAAGSRRTRTGWVGREEGRRNKPHRLELEPWRVVMPHAGALPAYKPNSTEHSATMLFGSSISMTGGRAPARYRGAPAVRAGTRYAGKRAGHSASTATARWRPAGRQRGELRPNFRLLLLAHSSRTGREHGAYMGASIRCGMAAASVNSRDGSLDNLVLRTAVRAFITAGRGAHGTSCCSRAWVAVHVVGARYAAAEASSAEVVPWRSRSRWP